MKRILSFFVIAVLLNFSGYAQTTLFSDDFESFTLGDYVAQSDASGYWTTWTNSPGGSEDAVISSDFNHTASGANSMLVSGANDMILKLGNKTSGTYEINFYYYLETGFGGYFNFQKYEAPGNEFAVEVYFHEDGTGRVVQNGDHTFTYPKDTWFLITTIIDLDNDLATMSINGTQVHSWPFNQQTDGTAGIKQLGGIDFYAGVEQNSGETPKYYTDDIEYIQTVAGSNPPTVDLSISDITSDGSANETFDVSNTGDQDLNYSIYVTYPQANKNNTINKKKILLPKDAGLKDRDGTLTNVQSAFTGGVGYSSPYTVNAASYFSSSAVQDFIGMELTNVIIGIYNMPGASSTSAKIWGRGSVTTPGPGSIIDEVAFTPSGEQSQNVVNLTTPVYIDGNPIWLGYQCDDTGDGNFPIAIDAGPRVDGVNWLSIGPGWSEMNSATDANIFIVGNLVGSAVTKWLSVSPVNGTVNGGGSETITATFNLAGLATGTYNSNIVVASNDQTSEYVEIPVTLDVANSIDKISSGIMTYPNPVTDIFTIASDNQINQIVILDLTGKVINTVYPDSQSYKFNLSNLESGVYIFTVKTESQIVTRKIIIE